jgi:hypothetical protein
MLEHLGSVDRYFVIRLWVAWAIGRLALIAAFLSALDNNLQIAVASLAIALWTISSQQGLSAAEIGKTLDALAQKVGVEWE